MKVMSSVRNGVICGVKFDKLPLPMNIPCNIKFSLNGECSCTFKHCRVERLGIFDSVTEIITSDEETKFSEEWARYSVYSPDKKFMLIILGDNYVLLWDLIQKGILWDCDLSQYIEESLSFDYAEFSSDEQHITFFANNGYGSLFELKINTHTGDFISLDSGNTYNVSVKERDYIDENLKLEICSQLTHFKNCNFRNAVFMYENYSKYLEVMGAVID